MWTCSTRALESMSSCYVCNFWSMYARAHICLQSIFAHSSCIMWYMSSRFCCNFCSCSYGSSPTI
jgi:hypothetical protein